MSTPTNPFKTIQACLNTVAANYNIGNFTVNIIVSAGIYVERIRLPKLTIGTGIIYIRGESRDTTILIGNIFGTGSGTWTVIDMCIKGDGNTGPASTVTQYLCIIGDAQSAISFRNCRFDDTLDLKTATRSVICTVSAGTLGIRLCDFVTRADKTVDVLAANSGGVITCSAECTVSGTGISGSFCYLSTLSVFRKTTAAGQPNAIFIGTLATGQRYFITLNSTADTQGGGANYFPGTAPGRLTTGGQYI